jgi:AcrR family transcriptional regulator
MRSAPAVRWRHAAPAQARSRETTERFARAAEELLRTGPFEDISIQDIVRRADRPIGSFYARFRTKDALLPFLYQRYHEGMEELVSSRLARVPWATLDLRQAVEQLVDLQIAIFTERPWLIRAMALFARTSPQALPGDLVERRRMVYEPIVQIFMRHRTRIMHSDPENAIRFGLFMMGAVAREKLLFVDAPHSRITPMAHGALRDELVRMLWSYLTCRGPR